MKKSILILVSVCTVLSLTAIGIYSHNEARSIPGNCSGPALKHDLVQLLHNPVELDMFFDMGSRFRQTITKTQLEGANTIQDLVPGEATKWLTDYQGTKVVALDGHRKTVVKGNGEALNTAQKELLSSFDHGADFYIKAKCKEQNAASGLLYDYDLVYYISVVPESQAKSTMDIPEILHYLRDNSRGEMVFVEPGGLRPGMIDFMVDENGRIDEVKLRATSGYEQLDHKIVELIANLPAKWEPAKDHEGNHVGQRFVISFGKQGC